MKDIVACLAGGFSSMPAHVGAMTAWQQSDFVPPGYICTSSAGGIVGSFAVQWHEPTLKDMGEVMINLRKRQFVSLNPKIKNRAMLTILATCSMFMPTQQIEQLFPKQPKLGRILRYLAMAGVTGTALWAQKKFVVDTLFHSESFLVYDNLIDLLMKKLGARSPDDDKTGFERIFSSKIKLELLSVNINKAGWTINDILKSTPPYVIGGDERGWVSKTNFRPKDLNLPENVRNLEFVKGVVNGTRIWSIFDAGRTEDGDFVVDTGALNNVPYHAAINEGYDKIALFYYNRSTEGPTNQQFESLFQITFRANDLIVAKNTRKTICGWFRVNHDLKELKKQQENLKKLEDVLDTIDINSEAQEKIRTFIRDQEESYRKLTYYHKKVIKFCIIKSEPLPPIHFAGFTRDNMVNAINIGARAFQDALPELEEMYVSV